MSIILKIQKHLDDLDSVGIQTLNNESLKINGINLIESQTT